MNKKFVLKNSEIKDRKQPRYDDFSSRVLINERYLPKDLVSKYLPDDYTKINRNYIWVIWESNYPESADKCFQCVMDGQKKDYSS